VEKRGKLDDYIDSVDLANNNNEINFCRINGSILRFSNSSQIMLTISDNDPYLLVFYKGQYV
jgi:hypothetical protein